VFVDIVLRPAAAKAWVRASLYGTFPVPSHGTWRGLRHLDKSTGDLTNAL